MAWVESPRSRQKRLIGNVRIEDVTPDDHELREGTRVVATASFIATRSRRDQVDTWMGHTRYRLVKHGESFKIAERTVYLNQDSMRPQNMLSIIL